MASEQHYQEPQTWYRVSPFSGISAVEVLRETPTRILYTSTDTRRCQTKEMWAHKKSDSHAFFSTLDQARKYELSCLYEDLESAKMEVITCQEKIERTVDSYQREDRLSHELTSAAV